MTYIVVPVSGSSGPITPADIVPITDGSFPSVGQLFEVVYADNAALSNTNVGATGAWGFAATIALDAGRWELQGIAQLAEAGAVLTDSIAASISDSTTGATIQPFEYQQTSPFFVGQSIYLLTPIIRISIAANTNYYLNTRFNYSSGAPEHAGAIWAKRFS